MLRKLLTFALLFSIFSLARAQNLDYQELHQTYNLKYRTFRVALVPGLSTNGLDAKSYASRYSLNILAGYNGALDRGFEFGSLLNLNKYYTHGGKMQALATIPAVRWRELTLAACLTTAGRSYRGFNSQALLI